VVLARRSNESEAGLSHYGRSLSEFLKRKLDGSLRH
jgi:hypothetical protein